jgi:hypothetical protein
MESCRNARHHANRSARWACGEFGLKAEVLLILPRAKGGARRGSPLARE